MIQSIRFQSLLVSMLLTAAPLFSHAALGPSGSGGGDLCENRIKTVRNDIESWILKGGVKGLDLSGSATAEQYSQKMLEQIKNARIKCVGKGDSSYPVMVGSTPKTCRFDKTQNTSDITCDESKIGAVSDSNLYTLVHHEYAGLAGLEQPDGESSNYQISNQITGFLESQTVKRLVVRSAPVSSHTCWIFAYAGEKFVVQQGFTPLKDFSNLEQAVAYMGKLVSENACVQGETSKNHACETKMDRDGSTVIQYSGYFGSKAKIAKFTEFADAEAYRQKLVDAKVCP